MAHVTDDRVAETTTTTGTGALTLAGALAGFKAFSAAVDQFTGTAIASPSDTCFYALEAVDANGLATGDYEVGLGTYSAANTLTRTTIIRSSNTNAVVSLSAGTKRVFLTLTSDKVLQLDAGNAVTMPIVSALPSAASTDTLRLYARKVGGRVLPKWTGPSGVDVAMQPALIGQAIGWYAPNTGTTVGLNTGLSWTSGGTVSHPTPASTSKVTQQRYTRWANVATTQNQQLGIIQSAASSNSFWRGNASGLGGWFFFARFGVALWPAATVRMFVGLTSLTTSMVATDTPTFDGIGIWHDTTDAASVLSLITSDGTTRNKAAISLAGNNLAAGQWYDFYCYAKPNDSLIYYRLDDFTAGTTLADSSTSTNIPRSTIFMGPQAAMSNGTANTTVTTTAFGLARLYCESDN